MRLTAFAPSLLLVLACGESAPPDTPASTGLDLTTYQRDIRPLMDRYCVDCHVEGSTAPFTLSTWTEVEPLAPLIASAVQQRRMPPFGMDPGCRPLQGAMWLDDNELAAFAAWQAGGYAQGDPADYVPGTSVLPPAQDLGEPDLTFSHAEGYAPNPARPDDYRCLVLGAPLEEEFLVSGTEVVPDQLDLVHHVIIFAAPPGSEQALAELERQDDAPGFNCFGDAGLDGASFIAGWVPGQAGADALPEGAVMRVPQGSQFIMQMHYNIAGRDPGASLPRDRTSLRLWSFPDDQTPHTLLTSLPVYDLAIDIAPGDPASQHTSEHTLAIDGVVVGNGPHMHLLGSKLRTELVRPDGSVQCLSDVQRWDFDWQLNYSYAPGAEVPISATDRVRITCEYDNSEGNQPSINGQREAPQRVQWGDGSRDEMCLDYLLVAVPYQPGPGACGGFSDCHAGCAESDAACTLSCLGNQGEQCLYCGSEALFGDCFVSACADSVTSLIACMDTCPRPEDDWLGCLLDHCAPSYDEYFACVDPLLRSGSCAQDTAACGELSQ